MTDGCALYCLKVMRRGSCEGLDGIGMLRCIVAKECLGVSLRQWGGVKKSLGKGMGKLAPGCGLLLHFGRSRGGDLLPEFQYPIAHRK